MKKILYICGSRNQTVMMHKISKKLLEYDNYFTHYYADGILKHLAAKGLLNFSVLGGKFKESTNIYLQENNLQIDQRGEANNYDLIITCSDLVIPNNIKNQNLILVQEGMTDPENFMYYLTKWFKLPRFLASTSTTGLSNAYSYFCVASEGYRDLFIKKGVKAEKIVVTGIPNFDDLQQYYQNSFPHKNFVLVATSDARETFKLENRINFIKDSIKIADGRKLIFKLHPNENFIRATEEIKKYAPNSLIYIDGDINPMVANCDVLITQYSTVSFVGLALNKEVYSYFDISELQKLLPIQNNGKSAENIAKLAKTVLDKFENPFHQYFEEWALIKGY